MTPLTPEQVAELRRKANLSGASTSQVRRRADAGEYGIIERRTRGRNANGILIRFERLSAEEQAAWFALEAQREQAAAASRRHKTAEIAFPEPPPEFHLVRDERRQRAIARHAAVKRYQSGLAQLRGITAAKEQLAEQIAAEIPELGGSVSVDSLERWSARFAAFNIDGLVDRNDGSSRKGKFAIPVELKTAFDAEYLRPTKPTIAQAWRRVKKVAIVHNLTMPSLAIFRRYEETIPVAVKKLFRDPDSKHSNLRPYIERDYSGLHAMQIIQSDHHQIDVAVRCGDPLCEAGHYPWITVWMDVRSRKVLAVEVYVEYPNSKRILKLLHRVLLENGPCEFVYADNGMDYVKSVGAWGIKHFDVGRRGAKLVEVVGFTPEILERICGPFGIQAIFSNEGNPQSKAIERWFETLKGRLYSDYDSYRGALGERSERAEWLRTHPAELPALQDLALNLQLAIEEYNDAPHRGDGMESRSPNVVFEATRLPVRELDRAALAQAFWDEKIGAKVQRLGIKHNHRWYALDAKVQATYFGRKVRIRYHDEDPEQIVVCDAGGAFIGIGRVRTKAPQFRGPEVAKANADLASEWKAIKAHLRAHNPDAAKRLAASGADIDAYRQLKARSSEATAPIAVAGGGSVVTVVDGHLSSLGRLIARAERDLENPAGLTPEELELARAIVPPTNEELEQLVRFAPLQAVPDETDEDASVNTELAAAGLRRLARERSEAGMCVYDLDCPNLGDFDEGMCVNHFNRVFGG